jgi:hypothetical protein
MGKTVDQEVVVPVRTEMDLGVRAQPAKVIQASLQLEQLEVAAVVPATQEHLEPEGRASPSHLSPRPLLLSSPSVRLIPVLFILLAVELEVREIARALISDLGASAEVVTGELTP